MSARRAHDINVIGSLQLLAACERTPTLRAIVVRGSAGIYGAEPAAPQFFTEDMTRLYPLRTRFQRDVGEIENSLRDLRAPPRAVTCTMLRYQPSIGPSVDTQITRYLSLPVVPTYLGFDPRLQLIHERDALDALVAAVLRPGAGPGERGGRGDDRADAGDPARAPADAAHPVAAVRQRQRRGQAARPGRLLARLPAAAPLRAGRGHHPA